MIHYGVIFFMLEKLAAVSGVSNLHVYAAMRGETLEEFLKTRNTQVIYSVAGNDAGKNLGAPRRRALRRWRKLRVEAGVRSGEKILISNGPWLRHSRILEHLRERTPGAWRV